MSRVDDRDTLAESVRSAHRRFHSGTSPRRTPSELRQVLRKAAGAAKAAAALRAELRRRTDKGNADRQDALEVALLQLAAVALPLRQEVGRLANCPKLNKRYGVELREASLRVRNERRKLRKMLPPAAPSEPTDAA